MGINIGVATSGGDAPGMNACVRTIVKAGLNKGNVNIFGIRDGILGLIRGGDGDFRKLLADDVRNIINLSGTILGTSRLAQIKLYLSNKANLPSNNNELSDKMIQRGLLSVRKNIHKYKLEGLILIGGDDTCKAAHLVNHIFNNKFPICVIPATIDNDIQGSDITIGFDSAVSSALHAIDLIRATATSHKRLFIVEVMGRRHGYIGLEVGLSSGAEEILIPEVDYYEKDLKKMAKRLINAFHKGQRSALIIVAEGVNFNLPDKKKESAAYTLAGFLQNEIRDWEIRVSVIGHIQRGAVPTFSTRILASEMGALAFDKIYKSIKIVHQAETESKFPILIGKKGMRYFWQEISDPPTKPHDRKLVLRRKRFEFLSY